MWEGGRGRKKEGGGRPGGVDMEKGKNPLAETPSFSHTAKSDLKRREGGREGGREEVEQERGREGGGGWMVEGVGKGRKSEVRGEEQCAWYRP